MNWGHCRFLARGDVLITRQHTIEMTSISFTFALLIVFIAFATDNRFACSIYTSRFENTPSSCRSNRNHVLRWWGMYFIEESVWMVEVMFWREILVILFMYGLYREKLGMSSLQAD